MKLVKLAICAAVLTMAIHSPADAGYRKHRSFKQQHLVWVPLFLGVGY